MPTMATTTVYIAIGTNLGDRAAHMKAARAGLAKLPRTRLAAFSPVYETEPVGPAGQGKYLNAVAEVETQLEPPELLAELRRMEQEAGRERHERWGSRTLDLDILLFGDRVIRSEELTVPHPRMHERDFVLRPLNDLARNVLHPVLKKSVRELLREISTA
jgi:2-amino-4-hydroxy-6-hydroxymethyldihydropteridine diphosphokinase